MKKLSDAQARKIWGWTEQCFHKALFDAISLVVDNVPEGATISELKEMRKHMQVSEHFQENLNRDYERNICKLTTEQLRLILEANQQRLHRRSQVTIDVILTELFERTMNGTNECSRSYKEKNEKQSKTSKRPSTKKKSRTRKPKQ